MKLIVGLGNPGKRYVGTRHNIGFWLLRQLVKEFNSLSAATFYKNSGFINECGWEIKRTISRLKISLEDTLVIHDDFDLPLGQFRLHFNRSAAGHKGVQSVMDELGSKAFWRLRVGIGKPAEGVEANDYVLEKFSPQEQQILDLLYPQILAAIKDWVLKK
jgi:PTH1 family peptidyl-tRNA hydrolase